MGPRWIPVWLVCMLMGSCAFPALSDGEAVYDASIHVDDGSIGSLDAPYASPVHLVTNDIHIWPAEDYALDIDGTGPKNAVGVTIQAADTLFGLDMQAVIRQAVLSGTAVLLHSVRASARGASADVAWQVYLGTPFEPGTPPDLDGGGRFTVWFESPTNAVLTGTVSGGRFRGGPGAVTIQLAVVGGAPPLKLNLTHARIEANVAASACTDGVLAGGVLASEVTNTLIPSLVNFLDSTIKANGCRTNLMCNADAGPSICSPPQCGISQFLDFNPPDGSISLAEGQAILGSFLAPDLDLDGDPDSKEATSIGIGFSCADATFDAPNE